MKRVLLWTANLLLLMTLSSTYAAPQGVQLKALSAAEINSVTAGICRTCPPPPPMVPIGEGWELWNSTQSTPVMSGKTILGTYRNTTGNSTLSYSETYNDECQYRITGGGGSLGTSLGLNFNRTYSCARTVNFSFKVPPRSSVTLYKATMSYYVTNYYNYVIYYDDGYQERTGLTDTTRTEYKYAVMGLE